MSTKENNPANFANRDKDEVREIAAMGGRASGKSQDSGVDNSTQSTSGSKETHQGGSKENNPGNFANRDKDELREIASKGGKASGEARREASDNFD